MEEFRQDLELMFDDMLHKIPLFKKKTYSPAFLQAFEQYRGLLGKISDQCAREGAEKADALASVIPDYALQKMQKLSRRDQEKFSLNFNLAMVAYVVPLFLYPRDPECEKLAEKMVSEWNAAKVTKMEIRLSTYEKIAAGFKKSWFSFGRSED